MNPLMTMPPHATRPPGPAPAPSATDQTDRLEAAFLEQMLKYMGPQAREGTGSGGAGEAQFQSFLTQEHAAILARRVDLRITAPPLAGSDRHAAPVPR